MLRRLHDPERGAGYVEYAAVILLVAAIASTVIGSGLTGRIERLITDAVDSVGESAPQADGPADQPAEPSGDTPAADTPVPDSQEGADRPEGEDGPADDREPPTGRERPTIVPADDPATDTPGGTVPVGGMAAFLPGADLPGLDQFATSAGDLLGDAGEVNQRVLDRLGERGQEAVDGAVQLFTTPIDETAANIYNGMRADLENAVMGSVAEYGDAWRNGEYVEAGLGVLGDAAFYAYMDSPMSFGLPAYFASEDRREQWSNGEIVEALTDSFLDVGLDAMPGPRVPLRLPDVPNAPDTPDVTPDPDLEHLADGPPPRPDPDTNGDTDTDSDSDSDSDQGSDSPSCTTGNSFLPGTPVLLADGTTAPIEDVAVGEEVLAFDPLTGEEGPREVTATITGDGQKTLVTLTIDTGDGTDTLTATDEHPFWVPDQAAWVDAIDLTPGTWLRTSTGTWTQITAVDVRETDAQRVHNLTVDDLHTYYALAGETPLLVHNSDCLIGQPLRDGIFGQSKADLEERIGYVVDFYDMHGRPPAMTHQGGRRGRPTGEYGNRNGRLPQRPLGYYTESDVWPSASGTGNRGTERLIFGENGEVYYTSNHYESFIRLR